MKDWVPLIGSSIVAVATLLTLYFTVRQNNKSLRLASTQHSEALAMAERREWLQWKRTKIADYCEEILGHGYQAASLLNSVATWPSEAQPFFKAYYEVNDEVRFIPRLQTKLQLVVGDSLDNEVQLVLDALADGMEAATTEYQIKMSSRAETYDMDGASRYLQKEGMARMETVTSKAVKRLQELSGAARREMESPAE